MELIKDIASLWPLVACFAVPFTVWILRENIRTLGRLRIKRGDIEAEVQAIPERQEQIKTKALTEATGSVTEAMAPIPEVAKDPVVSVDVKKDEDPLYKIIDLMFEGDTPAAKKSFEEMQSKEDDPENRTINKVIFQTLLANVSHDADALEELINFTGDESARYLALRNLAHIYSDRGSPLEAESYFRRAIATAKKPDEAAECAVALAEVLKHLDRGAEALELLIETITRRGARLSKKATSSLYRSVADLQNDDILRGVALQLAANSSPTDSSLRFSTAYAYGTTNYKPVTKAASAQYARLLSAKPDYAVARNNLGAAYSELGLKINAARQYQTASDAGQTLAMANLANLCIDAGLIERAQDLLTKARNSTDVHANVGRATVRIAELQEKEEAEISNIEKDGTIISVFLEEFGARHFIEQTGTFVGKWSCERPKMRVEIDVAGTSLVACWTKGEQKRRISGDVKGASIVGVMEHEELSLSASGFTFQERGRAYGYRLDPDTMRVLALYADRFEVFDWRRLGSEEAK